METASSTRQNPVRVNLKYQDAAAHLLVSSCPAVSSHLQSEFNETVIKNRIDMPVSRRHQVCGSCGSISTQETSTSLKIESYWRRGRHSPPKERNVERNEMRSIITKCKVCGVHTKTSLESSKRISISTQHKESGKPTPEGTSTAKRPSRSQRQAQRKKETSLQAMLTRSKSANMSNQSSFGLSFMDFMNSNTS
jgi:RNAse P Rpr2/Rpp21/SNM1 subunit domain